MTEEEKDRNTKSLLFTLQLLPKWITICGDFSGREDVVLGKNVIFLLEKSSVAPCNAQSSSKPLGQAWKPLHASPPPQPLSTHLPQAGHTPAWPPLLLHRCLKSPHPAFSWQTFFKTKLKATFSVKPFQTYPPEQMKTSFAPRGGSTAPLALSHSLACCAYILPCATPSESCQHCPLCLGQSEHLVSSLNWQAGYSLIPSWGR